jgi:hypothetical protein
MKCVYSIILVVLFAAACASDDAATTFVSNDDGGSSSRFFSRDSGTRNDSSTSTDSSTSRDSSRNGDTSTERDSTSIDSDAARDASVDRDNGEVVIGGPQVEIVEPLAAANPVDDDVLVETPITARCRVTKSEHEGAANVDPTSVMIALVVEDTVIEEKQGVSTGDYEYEATFTSSEMQGGPIAFRCSADDTANPSRSSFDEIETFYDPGPDIEVIHPEAETSISLNEQVRVEFRVVPLQLDGDDSESEIDEVSLKVAGVDIELEEVESEEGVYRAFVDFADTVLFPDTPVGSTPIVISATNQRTPTAAKRVVTYNIIVDGEGPDITIEEPDDLSIVSGEVVLLFTIEDDYSAIDNDSLVVEINDTPYAYDPEEQWSINDNDYTYRFDTRNISGSKVQITVNIDVNDAVGNAARGATMVLYLDNQPPLIDLDPPWIRERDELAGIWACSYAFDPVGPSAVNDFETVPEGVLFRAVVWDTTNTAPGLPCRYSRINRETVFVYLQDDTDAPFLIDTDGDGVCDELDSSGLPARKLDAVKSTGEPYFGGPSTPGFAADQLLDPDPSECDWNDIHKDLKYACVLEASDMYRVIKHTMHDTTQGEVRVIYATNVVEDDIECTGSGWEIGALVEPGPFCAAVRAEDNMGNVGISPPLVLCFDDSDTVENECAGVDLMDITCADDCEPPPGLD